MKMKIFLFGIFLTLVFLVGCKTEIKVECEDKTDCENKEGLIKKCIENKCVYQECFDEFDCNKDSLSTNWEKCIENKCIDFSPECERIATIDYGYDNPKCDYGIRDDCFCKDMKIKRYSQEIERNNSIEIIDAIWDFDKFVTFKIK